MERFSKIYNNYNNYNFTDFTHKHYSELLSEASKFYDFVSFNKINLDNNCPEILCRHDVDLSMQEALNLARIESDLGIKSTYFILFHSEFYNLLEKTISQLVTEIITLGHNIGLHFDATYYNITSKDQLEFWLQFEKEMLQVLFGVEVAVFSFHTPSEEVLLFDEWSYAGMINTYAFEFKSLVSYCSDSNGYWKFKRMYDVISTDRPSKLQILTHPEWWTLEVMSPRQKIWRSIDKRAEKNKEFYEGALKAYGRKLIDW